MLSKLFTSYGGAEVRQMMYSVLFNIYRIMLNKICVLGVKYAAY
jgi:hypothetical protein